MSEIGATEADLPVKIGEVLDGKFRIERIIGAGGMGVVVEATHLSLDQRVALKLLLPEAARSTESVTRFAREARAAAQITSEHVARVIDVGQLANGLPYMVMELLDGRDLGALLQRRGALPIALAVDYVLEACEAVAEAHASGIVHRDLKPANLFLARRADGSDLVKVLDFGISKTQHAGVVEASPALTKTTDVFGSPTYMSPEQLKASRDVDARSDVWSLAVILYELVAGAPPFGGGTVAEIFGAILYQPAPKLTETRKDAPRELENVLLRCFEKDPTKRVPSVAALAGLIEPFGSGAGRVSAERISRVLSRGPSDARKSRPEFDASDGARTTPYIRPTDPRAVPAQGLPPPPGGVTATSWDHVRPSANRNKPLRWVLGGALFVGVALGTVFVLRGTNSKPSDANAAAPVSASPSGSEPPSVTAERRAPEVPPGPSISPVSPSASASATPTGSARGPGPTPSPSGVKVPVSTEPNSSAPPTPTQTAAPAAPAPAPAPPATPPDNEFGDRK